MIGPGGENMVKYACVMNGLKDAAGRTGMGAVMGSKKLKAVAALGTENLEGADPDMIRETARRAAQEVRDGKRAAWAAQCGHRRRGARRGHPAGQHAHPQLSRWRVPRDQRPGIHHAKDRGQDGGLLGLRGALQEGGQGRTRGLQRGSRLWRTRIRDHRLAGLDLRRQRHRGRLSGQRAVQRLLARYHRRGRDHRLCHGVL